MRLITLNKIDYNQYAEGQDLEPESLTTPVAIHAELIRCFYARKQNRQGSRITFADGGGFAVLETVDQIVALLVECGATGQIMMAAAPRPAVAAPVLPAPVDTVTH